MQWTTSSHSRDDACIEIAHTPNTVHVRDSKHRTGPTLTIPTHQWRATLRTLT